MIDNEGYPRLLFRLFRRLLDLNNDEMDIRGANVLGRVKSRRSLHGLAGLPDDFYRFAFGNGECELRAS